MNFQRQLPAKWGWKPASVRGTGTDAEDKT